MTLNRTPPKNNSAMDTSSMSESTIYSMETAAGASAVVEHETSILARPKLILQQKHDSTPDLRVLQGTQENDLNNVTLRFKRRHYAESNETNMEAMMEQMKLMFASYSQEQAFRFNELHKSVLKIEKQNTDITQCVDFLSQKYEELLDQLKNMQHDKKKDKLRIRELEDKLETLERKVKQPVVEIRNLPLHLCNNIRYDSKEELCQMMKNLGGVINVDITDKDIKDIYSKKINKDTQKTIVTEFVSTIQKEKLLEAVRSYNKGKQNSQKLHSGHLGLKAPNQPIFVAEALTQKTQKLLFEARQVTKENGYVHCCTSRGSVFIRKAEKAKYIKINDEEDLANIKNSKNSE